MRILSLTSVAFVLLASTMGRASIDKQQNKAETPVQLEVATINIAGLPTKRLDSLKSQPGFQWWAEFGDTLVVAGKPRELSRYAHDYGQKVLKTWSEITPDHLKVIIAAHSSELPYGATVLTRSGRAALAVVDPSKQLPHDLSSHSLIKPFIPNTTYVKAERGDEAFVTWNKNQLTNAMKAIKSVDPIRWYLDVGTLTNWNRHVSSVGVVSARDWIKEQFDHLQPTSSSLQKFNVLGRAAWNVIATFDGGAASDIYIIGGHYDSISERTSDSAPGAEDNATGAAGVIELARVFANFPKTATLIFIAFSGEEQGLVGSKAYVRGLDTQTRSRVKAVLNMDMIGYSKDDSEDVLLESSSHFKPLVDHFSAAARLVEGLRFYISFNPYGSDHMPFIDSGIPAILTIDNDWGDYPSYHRTTDTIDKVSRDMGAAVLKMNAGALGSMLGSQ